MVTFSLSLALIPYALVVVLALALSVITAYHLVRYGATTKISFLATFAFFAGATLLLFFTWVSLRNVDWSQPVTIGPPASSVGSPMF